MFNTRLLCDFLTYLDLNSFVHIYCFWFTYIYTLFGLTCNSSLLSLLLIVYQGRIRTRRTVSSQPLLADPKIEKTARRNNSATRRRRAQAQQAAHHSSTSDTLLSTSQNLDYFPEEEMAKNPNGDGRGHQRRTLEDYDAFTRTINFNSIARTTVNARNMEMKPALIHLVQSNQFNGLANENPYTHLATFLEICNTMKIHQVPDEVIRLSLFPFSLAGNAKVWLNFSPENSLTS